MANKIVIKVDSVSKRFKLPHEKVNTAKSFFVNVLGKKRLVRSYEVQQVLDDVSFDIKEGEFVGIVGRNGSGKSTLLKILAGIYQSTDGHVEIEGKLVPFIELGVGFNPELTGRENVYLNGALLNFSKKEIDELYQDIVDFAELERFMDQKLKNYSSGMQVRLSFSLAIQAKADILLIDEVLAVGDADFQRKCFDYFKKLKKENTTVILVSHDMSAIREYCDRAILIEKGKITHQGDPEKIAQNYLQLFIDDGQVKPGTDPKKVAGDRWGDGQITIKTASAKVDDDSGMVHLKVSAVANADLEDPSLGFQVKTGDNTPLIGTNMKIEGHKLGLVKAGQEIDVDWEFEDIFATGTYFVSVAASHSDDIRVCDWWNEATTFSVHKLRPTPFDIAPDVKVKSLVK